VQLGQLVQGLVVQAVDSPSPQHLLAEMGAREFHVEHVVLRNVVIDYSFQCLCYLEVPFKYLLVSFCLLRLLDCEVFS